MSALPQTMRASEWSSAAGGLEKNLKVNDKAPLPKGAHSLGPNQTLVKIAYSALNPVDYKLPELPIVGRFAFTKPAIPCMDFSGTVVASRRSDLKAGQRVFGKTELMSNGALAEYAVVGPDGLAPLADNVGLKEAGGVGVAGLTAYQSLAPYVKNGDKVFINGGSGGTGTFGVQIAKALGCYVATSCSGPNVELCKSIGADEVIDYKTEDVVNTLKRKATQFDLIVDNAGSLDLYWQSHHYLKPSGKVVAVGGGFSIGFITELMKIFLIPRFLGGGQRGFYFLSCKSNADHCKHLGQMMMEGKVKPVVGQLYDLENAPEAFKRLKAGGFQGKLVVQVSKDAP